MKNVILITGIPTAGKSYLSHKLVRETGAYYLEADVLRDKLADDPRYHPWTNFYWDRDEREYYSQNGYETQWQNLVSQSEALWPAFRERILAYQCGWVPLKTWIGAHLRCRRRPQPLLLAEGVNLLPHLTRRDFDFPGIVIVGRSRQDILDRLALSPRWGKTRELQELEADAFWYGERPRYIAEAEKHGYPVFETADEAYPYASRLASGLE